MIPRKPTPTTLYDLYVEHSPVVLMRRPSAPAVDVPFYVLGLKRGNQLHFSRVGGLN